ncbi:hypothetical protein [Rhizobium laguerreae]|uniref:hypothetical protein n=1 Tax=Rhizobium laguerreae TaxID=1076926 RepID=UPI001C901F13|nr:hypothetical protein [Rhizobium laguerreae]MBY3196099.1 hypothetical protein [Rhizobium laguerreae]
MTDEAASDFSRRYISLNAAYQTTDLSRSKLNAILKERNIVPVFPVERVQAQFYNRVFAAISDALN